MAHPGIDDDYSNDPLIEAAMKVASEAHAKVQRAESEAMAEQLEKLTLQQNSKLETAVVTSNAQKRVSLSSSSPSRLPRPSSVMSNSSSTAVSSRSNYTNDNRGLSSNYTAGPRSVPATTKRPSITPRPTRASLLRTGGEVPAPPLNKQPVVRNPSESKRASIGPGVTLSFKQREHIHVASTRSPAIAPRMTKAAALRSGQPIPPSTSTTTTNKSTNGRMHRRTESESFSAQSYSPASGQHRDPVKAMKAPKIVPRMTKASQLRTGGTTKKTRPSSMFLSGHSPAGYI